MTEKNPSPSGGAPGAHTSGAATTHSRGDHLGLLPEGGGRRHAGQPGDLRALHHRR